MSNWDPQKHPRHPKGSSQGEQLSASDSATRESLLKMSPGEKLAAAGIKMVNVAPRRTRT